MAKFHHNFGSVHGYTGAQGAGSHPLWEAPRTHPAGGPEETRAHLFPPRTGEAREGRRPHGESPPRVGIRHPLVLRAPTQSSTPG